MGNEEIVRRAFNILKVRGIIHSQRDFANLLDVNEGTVSKALKGKEKYLTESFANKVSKTFLQVTGQRIWECEQEERLIPSFDETDSYTLTVIPTQAMAGTLGEFADSINEYECEQMVSPIKGVDYAIKVCGDSMTPEIPNGSQILIKKILEEQFVEWGKIFCLDTQNGAIIKKVFPTKDPEVIECRSVNPEFPPFTINVKYINGWYKVLMVLSMK